MAGVTASFNLHLHYVLQEHLPSTRLLMAASVCTIFDFQALPYLILQRMALTYLQFPKAEAESLSPFKSFSELTLWLAS